MKHAICFVALTCALYAQTFTPPKAATNATLRAMVADVAVRTRANWRGFNEADEKLDQHQMFAEGQARKDIQAQRDKLRADFTATNQVLATECDWLQGEIETRLRRTHKSFEKPFGVHPHQAQELEAIVKLLPQ